jgi:hypothetical protein
MCDNIMEIIVINLTSEDDMEYSSNKIPFIGVALLSIGSVYFSKFQYLYLNKRL